MIRYDVVCKALRNVVGWDQSFDPAKKVDLDLLESESGLTFQGAHPLVTLDNIISTIPEDFVFKYPSWDGSVSYHKGDIVRISDNSTWRANNDNTGVEPSTSEDWDKYNFLSDYLRVFTDNSIKKAIQNFLQMKQLTQETRSLLERRTFFDGSARLKATISPAHRLVGMEIIPVRSMGVTMKINKIGLQMVGATGRIKLYLFHSSQSEPIKTIEAEYTNTSGAFQWFSFDDLYLPYISEGTDAGGSWYLCYNQDELPFGMEALNVSKDWSREPCGTCNIGSVESWREITKYMQISPFCLSAPSSFSDNPLMWDVEEMVYTPGSNYGINCEVSVECDLTDFIISQRAMFANVIQKQVAKDLLHMMAMNPSVRVNRNQANVSRMDLLFEIEGNTSGRATGLAYELKEAFRALSFDTKGLDRICLTCHNGGVRYRSV